MFSRRARQEERQRAEDKRMASIGTATARILHQIKNPLQTILLHADLLQQSSIAADPTSRGEVCAALLAEAERMAAMLGELSLYASGAARALQLEPVALHELVGELARDEVRKAHLSVDATQLDECTAMADAYYLRQALENLISNAREAMLGQDGGRLTLRLERQPGRAVVEVIDTGPGIEPERLGSIFQPFVSGKSKGMGLGLAISREIVEGHGGSIDVLSSPGAGSCFRVFLPLHTPAASLDG